MKSRLLNLLTALALLLAVAVVALWVRSYRACDRLSWTGETSIDLVASRGRAELSRVSGAGQPGTGRCPRFTHRTSEPRQVVPGAWADLADGAIPGVHYARETAAGGTGTTVEVIALPHYLLTALALALPAARTLGALRSRRFRFGRYLDCGYDLRGNVSGVCPECGLPHR